MRIDRADYARYRAYLGSRAWLMRRCEVIARQYGKCAVCRRYCPNAMEIHHITYDRLGDEDPDDLTGLCSRCHRTADYGRRLGLDSRLAAWQQDAYFRRLEAQYRAEARAIERAERIAT